MRIGECVDLSPDCLRHLGDNRWTLHVPHGKPRSERWVPVDDQVRVLVERLAFLRTLPPAADPLVQELKAHCSASASAYVCHINDSGGGEFACIDEAVGASQR